jgi:hypothetical protein
MWWRSMADDPTSEVGPHWLAYRALTGRDEPAEFALEYLASAHRRLDLITIAVRQNDEALLDEALTELANVKLVLIGLAEALRQDRVKLKGFRGRPHRSRDKRDDYRRAARHLLSKKSTDGYHSAAADASTEFGLDKSEIKSRASHLENEPEMHKRYMEWMTFTRQAGGSFEPGEEREQEIFRAACEAVLRMRDGQLHEAVVPTAAQKAGISEDEMRKWVAEVGFALNMKMAGTFIKVK